jgi:P27 family predicted phage terminase small subunit
LLIAGRDDATVRNPLLIIQKQAAEELHRCGTELGLSPTARTRLGNPKPDADDPLEMLLGLSPKPV